VRIYLDRPVSNSGRLRALLDSLSTEEGWPWEVLLVDNPDRALLAQGWIVASSDGPVLDACGPWVALAETVVRRCAPRAWIIDLG
jgi:hypothetical protein